jgi:signal transduction histidine kinase
MEEVPGEIGGSLDERTLRRLIAVGRALVSQLDLETVLGEFLEVARELTGARYAALGILDESRQEIEAFLASGVDEKTREAIGELPRGRGVLRVLIDEPTPLRLNDVGSHPRSFGFPPGHPDMKTFLGVPIIIRGEAYGNLYLAEKATGPFDEADEEATLVLAEWAAIAIENARLYTSSEERRRQLERAVGRLEATAEIARAVGGETNLDRVLATIVKRARALVEARSVVILLEDERELEVVATAGEFERDVRGERLAIGWTTWGGVLRGLRPERVADVEARLGISPQDLGLQAKAALLVPLNFRGSALGVIAAFDRLALGGPEFDEEDERLLDAFAASAATAVSTAKSVAEDRLRHSIDASERERARWARELHDDTLQALGAMRVVLSSAARTASPEVLRETVDRAVDQLGEGITAVRGLIAELRPAALDELGLVPAIEGLIEQQAAAGEFEIDAELEIGTAEGGERLDPELESGLYRVVQEALTNVVKHSAAERVRLVLRETNGRIDVRVRDDGSGFDLSTPTDGFGLLGIRERIELAGGELDVTSRPGEGTELRAWVPARPASGASHDVVPKMARPGAS